MTAKAEETGCILSVAENYRRDPMNRLARALLDAGVIGPPRLMQQVAMAGGDRMVISDWRHQKNSSGILLDAGVHYADIMEYFLGEADTVYAQTRLHEPVRRNPVAGRTGVSSGSPGGVYERWQKDMPAEFEATADDAAYATILFKSGAVAQYIEDHAAHGENLRRRSIHGSLGSLELPGDRSGNRLTLHLDGADPVDGEALLDLVPDHRLDEATAALFGGDRLFEYPFPFPETDRKLIAVEYHELGTCIQQGAAARSRRPPGRPLRGPVLQPYGVAGGRPGALRRRRPRRPDQRLPGGNQRAPRALKGWTVRPPIVDPAAGGDSFVSDPVRSATCTKL